MKIKGGHLYRDSVNSKVAGVCSGIAHYFGWEVWLVRVIWASAVLLGWFSGLPFLAYLVLWMVLDKKPLSAPELNQSIEVKTKFWQAGEPPLKALRDINGRFRSLELRLRSIERHVIDDSYQLRQEINKL
ncbi:envelope stress response membrane protein PspC [Paraferrimonas sp. SM1919]|uniref:envelope stress response membrane protein PspC n=1 Tax=Paraferrimonas sp. SM1919 TaxID=2662263 RepID=UPI0013D37960|nr:envelope stress response membrane protein PspC [Paraferrimonas sp. SM1919]